MANKYGKTPWGAWFIDILDSYEMGERINRGKTYANTGRVLDFSITNRKVVAKIKGNYSPFYTVAITFPEIDAKSKEKLNSILENNLHILAEIARGELSESFLQKLKEEKINLIPQKWNEMKRSCDCPDSGDPCKHMASIYFILAKEVDANPLLLFTLGGIDLEAIVSSMNSDNNSLQNDFSNEIPAPFVLSNAKNKNEIIVNSPFPPFPDISSCLNLILALLPNDAHFYNGGDFGILLAEFYHSAQHYKSWLSGGGGKFDERRASSSTWRVLCDKSDINSEVTVVEETIDGETFEYDLMSAFIFFSNVSTEKGGGNFILLVHLFKFIHALLCCCAFIPHPIISNGKLSVVWIIYEQLEIIKEYKSALAEHAPNLLFIKNKNALSGDSAVNLISTKVLTLWTANQHFAFTHIAQSNLDIPHLFFQNIEIDVRSPSKRSLPLMIWRYLSILNLDFRKYKYRMTLKESVNVDDAENTEKDGYKGIELSLSFDVLWEKDGSTKPVPLKDAGKICAPAIDVLKAPSALCAYLPEIKQLFIVKAITLKEERLLMFLDEAQILISKLGIEAVLPKTLRNTIKPRLVLKTETKGSANKSLKSYLDLFSVLEWNWKIALGDEIITEAEYKKLLKQKSQIVKFKNNYIRLDADELSKLFNSANPNDKTLGVNEFLKNYFQGNVQLSFDAEEIMNKVLQERKDDPPASLNANLRPYQIAGFRWVLSLLSAGFGCILADDMGLGKTIQAISVILQLKKDSLLTGLTLIVCPAALLQNWDAEIKKFAPVLNAAIYHGKGRKIDHNYDCIITTYQTAALDIEKFKAVDFSFLIIDEAHILKNKDTKNAKAVRALHSNYKLALSGTPIENRLEDLRSLFDVIIPGYLGTPETFLQEYRKPIEVMHDKARAEKLRAITSPFLLRREKTDKSIIDDLPDKIISNHYIPLKKEQAALYESVTDTFIDKYETVGDKTSRAALLFSFFTALKQICGHPRVYDKESAAVSQLSGKAEMLLTLLEEAINSGEKILVFSQYVETLNCLHTIIKKELLEEPLLYHGQLAQTKRADIVNQFQNDSNIKIMLISLKAGGLGLNLTSASQVFHYDLWYNPSVESQAEDRAFRIGQKKNVFVHRFITKNSFEEKIDAMLTSKKELAKLSVKSGESWLSRLSKEELYMLFDR